jgi:hypothetical protein
LEWTLKVGETVCRCGTRSIGELSAPSVQFFCEPNLNLLCKNVFFQRRKCDTPFASDQVPDLEDFIKFSVHTPKLRKHSLEDLKPKRDRGTPK